ncbi:polymorphic toxin type 46 domain-containing protein [Enterobacter asburiae]|uniref:polymorphic toxin type 46 domain-containing protein n=1 Tax=Enterobacter asburiae TaxID=61645 RepID=UPI0005E5C0A4|nr:polymorphic toxin type 46 domain-containing protein [Enterobacter asburiae]KJI81907.1 type IV secretion protein Rhs [Enterobacter asburiae]MDV5193237.1 polymorphic toxin type 46 domain-containing protein [Enterobacter asburiae]MDV5269437.1 polymorphic toxin type 46 domain-containing protein [Enterobacter asburiae]OAZ97146.1 type IV secretion protein Rhs [Enterobacter asburiae]RUN93460.1 type IV secretion protein Rhs [Enterobacter asburiae]
MSECLAARVDDEIAHTASKGWMIAGLVGGAILGAAAVVVTGGTALVAVSAVAAGACAAGGLGELLGSMSWAPRHTTGTLKEGSPNVFINSRKAIRAHLSAGECDEHSGSLQRVAEGSIKVYINNFPASRTGDKLTCSAEISQGSRNVIIGGSKVQTDEISPEIPEWVNWTMLAVGAGAMAVLASPAIALLSTLGAMGGGTVGSYAGGMLFGEGSDGQKWGMLIGSVIGGGAGMKGGARFDAWRAGKPVLEPVKPNISARRAELNEKFGRTGDLNRDITARGNKELARNWLESKGFTPQQIRDFDNGIDYTNRVSVETINRNKTLYQNQVPGGRQGNWYALREDVKPTELGINPKGTIYGTDQVVDKVAKPYVSQQKVEMLRSTSLPALDTWSVKDVPYQTKGGAIQMLSSEKDIFKVTHE